MAGRAAAAGALLLVWSGTATATDAPLFVNEAASAGIDHRYTGGWEYFVGGGVAVFDCSGDGYPELFLAGGTSPAKLLRNASPLGGPLAFVDETERSGLGLTDTTGAYPLDLDGDAITDLVVLRVGQNFVLRGLGDCRFEVANDRFAIEGGNEWTTAFSATWETGLPHPTLAFGNYVDRHAPGAPFGTCHDNYLHRPADEGSYAVRRPLRPGFCALSILFSDWDRDGNPDLRVSNDRQYYIGGQEQLWRFTPGAPPRAFSEADGWRRLRIWGMGIASYDLTGSGFPDYFLTSMSDNKLQTLAADGFGRAFGSALEPAFEDIAFGLNVTLHRPYVDGEIMPSTGWHAEFDDVNNDGFADLFVAKGNVEGMIDFARRDPNNLVLGEGRIGPEGAAGFREAAPEAGIVTFERARGAALADLNLDGLLDLVVVNREAPAEIWRNTGGGLLYDGTSRPMGNWVALRLNQRNLNRAGLGAWVEVRSGAHVWRREVTVGGGHAGGEWGWTHFGVGTAERVEVRVQWPDGEWGPWVRAFANHFLVIDRALERPGYWYPAPAADGRPAEAPALTTDTRPITILR